MAVPSEDMKRVVAAQRLGFYATVCADGSPDLSPKGRRTYGTTTTCSSPTSAHRVARRRGFASSSATTYAL